MMVGLLVGALAGDKHGARLLSGVMDDLRRLGSRRSSWIVAFFFILIEKVSSQSCALLHWLDVVPIIGGFVSALTSCLFVVQVFFDAASCT